MAIPARLDTEVLGTVTEGELCEVVLEAIVASHSAIGGDGKQLLILRPTKPLDSTLIPLDTSQWLASTAINLDAWLGGLGGSVGNYLALVPI